MLRLIDLLYSCADGESAWATFLRALTEHFAATVIGLTTTASLQAVVGVDPIELQKYQKHYLGINPWFGQDRSYPEGAVLLTEEVLPLAAYRKTAFYNDWGKRNLVTHAIGGAIQITPTMMLFLSVNRGDSQEPFDENHRETARMLMPHLKRAANLHDRINGLEERAWVLGKLSFPIMYVSTTGKVLWANQAAENLLRSGCGLCLRGGKLRAEVSHEDVDLQRMLNVERAIVGGRIDGYGGWLQITKPEDSSELSLFLTRPPDSIRRSIGVPEVNSGFLVFIATQAVDANTLASRIRQTWGLTVSEAALAVELLETEGLQAAAEKLRISRNTAKTQLSAIFQKAGIRRQSELVRKLLALSIMGSLSAG